MVLKYRLNQNFPLITYFFLLQSSQSQVSWGFYANNLSFSQAGLVLFIESFRTWNSETCAWWANAVSMTYTISPMFIVVLCQELTIFFDCP